MFRYLYPTLTFFFFSTYKFKKSYQNLKKKKKTFYTIDNYLESKRVKIKNFLKQHASPSLVIKSEASKINWDFLGFKLITRNFDFRRNKPKGDSKLRYSQNNLLVSNTQITFLLQLGKKYLHQTISYFPEPCSEPKPP